MAGFGGGFKAGFGEDSYGAMLARLDQLPYAAPLDLKALLNSFPQSQVMEHARSVRPILHSTVRSLLTSFLHLKRSCGSDVERAFYSTRVTDAEALVTRLLTCRPLVFWLASDHYVLRHNNAQGSGGFEEIGTSAEGGDLVLERLLSYDEMALSALVGVSVPTRFINSGGRDNAGKPGKPGSFEEEGIYVGLVGTRLEKEDVMEWRHCVITPTQNTTANGYGASADINVHNTRLLRLWAGFYGCPSGRFPTYAEATAAIQREEQEAGLDRARPSLMHAGQGRILNADVYRQRMRRTAEAYLLEANDRAAAAGRKAFVSVLGLGLGVWKLIPAQARIFLQAFSDAVSSLPLPHVSDLDFVYIDGEKSGLETGGRVTDVNGSVIRTWFTKGDPMRKLGGKHEGKLLVAMYAWDGNSWPGNEYWLGHLTASGDPAAMCCSTLAVLQNPDVNPRVHGRHAVYWG